MLSVSCAETALVLQTAPALHHNIRSQPSNVGCRVFFLYHQDSISSKTWHKMLAPWAPSTDRFLIAHGLHTQQSISRPDTSRNAEFQQLESIHKQRLSTDVDSEPWALSRKVSVWPKGSSAALPRCHTVGEKCLSPLARW